MSGSYTFTKAERLCSQATIDWLFDGKGQSFSVFPLRIIYKSVPVEKKGETFPESPLPQILLSVPKKKIHHAVERNRIKRMLREAYRKQKSPLIALAAQQHLAITLAFIYVTDEVATTAELEERVSSALSRMVKTLQHESAL